MAKKRSIGLLFPARGLDTQTGYQNQPPYSSPNLQNVRPFDTIEGRGRGGSRPGLRKGFITELGSGTKVNLLSSVTLADDSGFRQFSENFQISTLSGNGWSAISTFSDNLPTVYVPDDAAIVYTNDTAKGGAVADAFDPTLDVTQAYTVELMCVPYNGTMGGDYYLFAGMNDTTPDPYTDGLIAKLTMDDATDSYSGNLTHYKGGVLQNTYTFTGLTNTANAKARKLWFLINGTSVKVYVDGTLETSQTITLSSPTTSYKRCGFGLEATVEDSACMVESFLLQYYTDTEDQVQRTITVAGSNGYLYKETFEGVFELVTTGLTLNASARLRATELAGKLYIADHGDTAARGTDGTLSGGDLDAASYSDWTTVGLNVNDFVVVITNGTGDTTDGTYEISSITAGSITLSTDPGDGTCSYEIQRGPKVYDPVADTLTLWTATSGKGQVPTGATVIATYRARIIMGFGRLWAMSRQYDPDDWDYGASDTDYARAVAGQNADAGDVGQPITAIAPHNDDYVIFGSKRTVYILRGDPTYDGASLGPLSQTIGIVGGDAWCETDNGELIFLSAAGVYGIAPGGVGRPQMISRAIPQSLKNLTADQFQVSMAYDTKDEGVHLYVYQSGINHVHYWLDWQVKGFFPVKLQTDHVPFCVYVNPTAVQNTSDVLLGCSDGYVRRYSEFQPTDDALPIVSYVEIGPIRLGDGLTREGILDSLTAILDDESGDVDWSLQVGTHAQQAVTNSTTIDSGTWDHSDSGIQLTVWPKIRGHSIVIRLDNSNTTPWAMEQIAAQIQLLDMQRLV